MDWKEIILSALRNNEDLEPALEKAERIAPREISLLLKNFPENIEEIAEKILDLPKVISLLFFHFFIINGENFSIFPLDRQRSILLASVKASIRAASIAADIGEKKLEALYFFTAGNSFYQLLRFSEAEKAYTKALERYRLLEKKNPEAYTPDIAKVLNGIGSLYSDTKRFHEAEMAYTEALEKYRAFVEKNPETYTFDMILVLSNLGNLYYEKKKFIEAEEYYKEALEKFRILEKENPGTYTLQIAVVLSNCGNFYRDAKRFCEAEMACLEALEICRTLERENPGTYTLHISLILTNTGMLYYMTRDFSQAEKFYLEALEKCRVLENENFETYTLHSARILGNLGNLYWTTKRFHESDKAYTEALERYEYLEKENPGMYTPYISAILNNLGNLYWETRKFFQAEKAYLEALEKYRVLAEENPEIYTFEVARAFDNLGNLYKDTRKFSEAEKAYFEALEEYRALAKANPEIYTHEIVLTLNNIGNLLIEMKRFVEAEKAYNEALEKCRLILEKNPEIYTPDEAMILKNVGFLYCLTGRLSEAERVYTEALEKYRALAEKYPGTYTSDVAGTLNSIGVLCRNTERFSRAEKVCSEALEQYKQAKLWFNMAESIHNISKIKNNRDIMENSRKILELAILFLKEEKYKYAYKGNYEYIYLDSLERNIDTFGVLEALRDPQLLSFPWHQVLSPEELEKAQNDIEFQKSLIEGIQGEQVPHREPVELPENLLFIYIQRIRNHFSFFTIESGTVREFTCEREFFSLGVKLLYLLKFQQVASKSSHRMVHVEKFETLSRQWYELLPSELSMLIQEKDFIAFSPDQLCSFLPLEALQSDDQPLCMEKSVVRVTSLHQFLALLTRKRCSGSSLIIGNPWPACKEKELIYSLQEENFSTLSIFFLKGAEMEARILKELLPKPTLLLGHGATGERFTKEISGHSLIHFSGHGSSGRTLFLSGPFKGFPPPFEPEEFLNFRKTARTRGIKKINMMEEWHPVTDLDLFDTPLINGAIIFLNACETGKHKYAGGGYYQGLPAVFLKNGAHSVISSLTPIFDEPSKEFAVHFYRNLLNSHSVVESIREARVWIKNKYEAQVHWIPYIHYGSPF